MKRFNPASSVNGRVLFPMEEDKNGEYVRYEEYEKLLILAKQLRQFVKPPALTPSRDFYEEELYEKVQIGLKQLDRDIA